VLVPGEALVVFGGVLVASGSLELRVLLGLVCLGAILGDSLGYELGCRLGRPWLLRYGRRVGLREPQLAWAEALLTRHAKTTRPRQMAPSAGVNPLPHAGPGAGARVVLRAAEPRLGSPGRDGDRDIVEGIVLMRRGEKTLEVLARLEAEVQKINTSGVLPAGVQIRPFYDRRDLIDVTTHTVLHNVLFGIVLIFVIQYLFLGDLRSALIVSASIPVAIFFSVILMVLRGDSANLLSIGAIDFGIIVDATVLMVENIFRHLRAGAHEAAPAPADGGPGSKVHRILVGAAEVDKTIFFSTAIIIAAFIPLFTMQGVEGQIFAPMAKTYGYALLGTLLATFTVAPMLASFLLPEYVRERETLVVRALQRVYRWLLATALRHGAVMLGGALALLALAIALVLQLGTEFLPKLEEGNLWIRATLPPTIALDAGEPYVVRMREILRSVPEVITVISQHGRPDDGTDPTGFFNVEFFVPLKPFDQWREGWTKARLIDHLKAALEQEFVGVDFNFSQNIQDNVEEAVSGVKGENSVKLFGTDLQMLEAKALAIKQQLASVRGIEDLGVLTVLGQPKVLIEIDRQRCARYGLVAGDVNAIVQAAIGGQSRARAPAALGPRSSRGSAISRSWCVSCRSIGRASTPSKPFMCLHPAAPRSRWAS
jgi:heavy metal efflux system protein